MSEEELNMFWRSIFDTLKDKTEGKMSSHAFNTWFSDLSLVYLDEKSAVISTPKALARNIIMKRYENFLVDSVREALDNDECEVEVICDEIESYNDSPSELIYDEFENIIFEGTPLGHNILGTADHVRQFKTADAKRFTSRLYRPERAVFFASGDVSFDHLVSLLCEALHTEVASTPLGNDENDTQAGEGQAHRLPISSHLQGKTFKKQRDTHQAHVVMGCRGYAVSHPRRIALYLLNNILGGPGMNARLNLSLRERNGLVYTVESTSVNYAQTGLWCIYFGCDHADVDRCLALVRDELDAFIQEPLEEEALRKAQQQIKGQIALACDNRENFAIDFGKSFLHYGKERDIARLYAEIDAVTTADIQAVAQELFPASNLTTLIYE